jgi:hypothetical protein
VHCACVDLGIYLSPLFIVCSLYNGDGNKMGEDGGGGVGRGGRTIGNLCPPF